MTWNEALIRELDVRFTLWQATRQNISELNDIDKDITRFMVALPDHIVERALKRLGWYRAVQNRHSVGYAHLAATQREQCTMGYIGGFGNGTRSPQKRDYSIAHDWIRALVRYTPYNNVILTVSLATGILLLNLRIALIEHLEETEERHAQFAK